MLKTNPVYDLLRTHDVLLVVLWLLCHFLLWQRDVLQHNLGKQAKKGFESFFFFAFVQLDLTRGSKNFRKCL